MKTYYARHNESGYILLFSSLTERNSYTKQENASPLAAKLAEKLIGYGYPNNKHRATWLG